MYFNQKYVEDTMNFEYSKVTQHANKISKKNRSIFLFNINTTIIFQKKICYQHNAT